MEYYYLTWQRVRFGRCLQGKDNCMGTPYVNTLTTSWCTALLIETKWNDDDDDDDEDDDDDDDDDDANFQVKDGMVTILRVELRRIQAKTLIFHWRLTPTISKTLIRKSALMWWLWVNKHYSIKSFCFDLWYHQVSGLSKWVGSQLANLDAIPSYAIVIIVCVMITTFTEVTSNTATATIFLPILASLVSSFPTRSWSRM